jgi:hypothetical protein
MNDATFENLQEAGENIENGHGPIQNLKRNWSAMGRCGQIIMLSATLFATAMVMLATAEAAYGGSCAGTSVAMADIGTMMPPLA